MNYVTRLSLSFLFQNKDHCFRFSREHAAIRSACSHINLKQMFNSKRFVLVALQPKQYRPNLKRVNLGSTGTRGRYSLLLSKRHLFDVNTRGKKNDRMSVFVCISHITLQKTQHRAHPCLQADSLSAIPQLCTQVITALYKAT
jgi:hypothetical protein